MPRAEMTEKQIAELVANYLGMNVENMSYQWMVDDLTGEFQGVTLFTPIPEIEVGHA